MGNEIEIRPKNTLEVFDAETQEWKKISQNEQQLASYMHNQIMAGVYYSAAALTKMLDEKLYIALGCESRDEYIDTMLPYSRRQAYILLAIGRKFSGILGGISQNKLISAGSDDGVQERALNDNMSENTEIGVHERALNELGIKKLYEMTKFEDSEIEELLNTGSTRINGNDFSLEEIKEKSAKDLSIKMAQVKKQYSGKISQLQEEISMLKEEKKLLLKNEEQVKTAVELEKLYGAPASKLEDKKSRLNKSFSLLNDFIETFARCGITTEDPELVQQQAVDLVRQIDSVYTRAQGVIGDVIANVSL